MVGGRHGTTQGAPVGSRDNVSLGTLRVRIDRALRMPHNVVVVT